MKASLIYGIVLAGVFSGLIVACGKNNSDNPQPQVTYSCPAGSYYASGYCYNSTGQQLGSVAGLNFISDNYQYRNLSISNSGVFKNFLVKAMGVCDRATTSGGSSGGIYACDSWINGYFQAAIQTPATQSTSLAVQFSSYPYVSSNYWYGYQLPSVSQFFLGLVGFPTLDIAGAMRNPLPLNMTVSVINQNKGFEARGYGDLYTYSNRSLIQVVVMNGKLEDQQFDYQIAFEGQVFATGRFVRY